MTTPEELIAMRASPMRADISPEEIIKRQQRYIKRVRDNADSGLEGDGSFRQQIMSRAACIEVAPLTETQ
jgi:hypothetical protein